MSKFAYKAEGELNSQYLLDLLKEYLSKLLDSNNTNGIIEDDYKIDTSKSIFVRKFKDKFKRLFNSKESLDNYNKVLSTKYINDILNRIDIFMESNELTSKQIFDLKQTLKAINFDAVLPIIDINREEAIRKGERKFLKVLKEASLLKYAKSNYILYNSPVTELKPFLSDKVSEHQIDYNQINILIKQFIDCRYAELNDFNFKGYEVEFIAKPEDFYNEKITDNGVGEEVEEFIRSKIIEKAQILKHEEELLEDLQGKVAKVDMLLKRLKVLKIENMIQQLIVLKTNLAHVKEVMDKCKDTLNLSTIPNKAQIFLVMDNLYYKLSQKCEKLEQKTKLKLQLVDKQKLFTNLEILEQSNQEEIKPFRREDFNAQLEEDKIQTTSKSSITSNLYDDDDEDGEIHISEDDEDSQAEDEIVIDDEQN